jgi:hypothetical protein
MPLFDVKCRHCGTERELIVYGNGGKGTGSTGSGSTGTAHFLICNSDFCKGKMRKFYLVDRVYPAAIRFVDGVSQWESNEKKAKALRKGTH